VQEQRSHSVCSGPVGAAVNAADALRHSREFFGEFAQRGWFGPARSVAARLIVPNGVLFAGLLMVFQVAVAVSVLTRTTAVVPALVIGGCFAAGAAFFLSPGPAVVSAGLAHSISSLR